MSFEFLKAENQFLETGLQTTTHNIFLEVIVRIFFYKNSMNLNKTLVVEPIQLASNSRFMSDILVHNETPMVTS
jgi:hypothetical protein